MTDFTMNPTLANDVKREIDFGFGGKVNAPYINKIECPTCSKKEAFTDATNPWVIKCGRLNKCGEHHHIKELFPHLFETWTERYNPKTEQERKLNPTAVADGYLRDGRGFELSKIKGWYTQEHYVDNDTGESSTTVRFKMPNGFWEKLLDDPKRFAGQPARCIGEFRGLVWIAPIFKMADICDAGIVYITEGIFDAISWIQHGYVAVSNISSSNYPSKFLEELAKYCANNNRERPTIIWAQDGDKAGRNAIKKFSKLAALKDWKNRAAQPPVSRKDYDWNDLHQLERMDNKNIEDYLHFGDLLLATTAADKAMLMYHRKQRRNFWFTFETDLYWFKLDFEIYERELKQMKPKDDEEISAEDRQIAVTNARLVTRIATAIPRPLYFQENKITNEQWYYFAVETAEGVVKMPFTPKQLTSAGEFKNRLLAAKNAWWVGRSEQLEQLLMDMTHNIKTVETVDFVGYSKEHGAYIWNDCAVKNGKAITLNSEDYFQFGRLSVKTLAQTPELDIKLDRKGYNEAWASHLYKAFQDTGLIACAWWLGSLFAEQIRGLHKSYPFFELIGEPGAGKSTLLEFLWKLTGRSDYEGFDPQKATVAARAREFSQVSNLPVALIESDREGGDGAKAKQFDWDDLKTAYNGRPMRSRGVKNNGNDTYAPPFRGAVLISQNDEVNASEAILSRICHIRVTREFQTKETYEHAQWLERADTESLSHFAVLATQKESDLLNIVEANTEKYKNQLLDNPNVRMVRVALIHGQMMALVDCLGPQGLNHFKQDQVNNAKAQILTMAEQRQRAINDDHPIVQEFWEAVDFIDSAGDKPKLNHDYMSGDDENEQTTWAINLKEFERWCGEYRLRIPEMREIKRHLKSSKNRKFEKSNHAVRSKIEETGKTVKCWTFKRTTKQGSDE